MLSVTLTLVSLYGSLGIMGVYAIWTSSRGASPSSSSPSSSSRPSLSSYCTTDELIGTKHAKISGLSLGWSFFASGMGTWVLYSFPEVGIIAGSWGVIGYALACCLPLLILGIIGPKIRSLLGEGKVTWSSFMLQRYGRSMQLYTSVVALLFQFISLSAELTGIGELLVLLSPQTPKLYGIIGVAFVTTLYTVLGGLKASMSTDKWQGIGVIALVALVCTAMLTQVNFHALQWKQSNVAAFTDHGFQSLITLCVAVTSANLFLTGFWQRVCAAPTDAHLQKACCFASLLSIPFALALAVTGMVAELVVPGSDLPFFALLTQLGSAWEILVVVLVTCLATSSIDSIQLGIAAELMENICCVEVHPNWARVLTAVVNIPAIVLAMKGINILTLFLFVDLLTATAIGPMLLANWHQTQGFAALAGCVSGVLAVFIYALTLHSGNASLAMQHFLLLEGVYATSTMVSFLLAVSASTACTVFLSLLLPRQQTVNLKTMPSDVYPSHHHQEDNWNRNLNINNLIDMEANSKDRSQLTFPSTP